MNYGVLRLFLPLLLLLAICCLLSMYTHSMENYANAIVWPQHKQATMPPLPKVVFRGAPPKTYPNWKKPVKQQQQQMYGQ